MESYIHTFQQYVYKANLELNFLQTLLTFRRPGLGYIWHIFGINTRLHEMVNIHDEGNFQ